MSSKYNSQHHHRRSIRLRGWDYRQPAHYFVTICTHERQYLFENETFSRLAADMLNHVPKKVHASHIALDEWVIMPNHVHAIFIFKDYPPQINHSMPIGTFQNALAGSLSSIVGQYKAAVTTRINNLRGTTGAKVWQRGFWERIIRDEQEWRSIQQYIINNPINWANDKDNLEHLLSKMTHHP